MIRTLKATKEDDLWLIPGKERTQEFKEIVGGIGYGNPSESGDYALNAIAVVGLQTDDHLNVLGEFVGEFDELKTAAIDLKDLFLLVKYYLDPNYAAFRRELNQTDGLTQYKKYRDMAGRERQRHDNTYWKHYRPERPMARLLSVRDDILEEMPSAIIRMQSLIRHDVMLVHDTCTKIKHLNKENFKQGINHPLLKALVFAVSPLAKQLEPKSSVKPLPDSGYGKRL